MISTIDGMGGIGKTALAVRLAHQLRHQYPDGQHFIDLRGFTAGRIRSPRRTRWTCCCATSACRSSRSPSTTRRGWPGGARR